MSSDDWTQLEHLTAHLDDLYHRRLLAERRDNVQLAKQIDEQIASTQVQRRRLLGRIRLRLIEEA
jgi:hypothetical protein